MTTFTKRTRLPGNSEVLESCFGKFKMWEREKSKGGFGLLPGNWST